MADLFFLRHGPRADFAGSNDPPIYPDYKPYDPLVTILTVGLVAALAAEICGKVKFSAEKKKNIYIHFSPYLRCCQLADLLATALQKEVAAISEAKPRFHLLGDFALSEWIHDNMKNEPPFLDLTEAYQMYTPNVRLLENRKMCLNFRPTTQLGPWNESGLLFTEYQHRCRQYLQKLLATYDKPSHDEDMVIVVAHGYVVSSFLSSFVNHPIFEEIPELGLNFAHKSDGVWTLQHDCLGLLEKENNDGVLNLESDIVYYKTNFVKKDAFNELQQFPAMGFGGLKRPQNENEPRPSFKVQLEDHKPLTVNPLCPAAKDWDPRRLQTFRVKSEFAIKVMNDEAFKKAFDLLNPPTHPVSPEVSPNSEPTRTNLTVDLSKLRLNEEIYHPFKLRYSLASDIPVQYLNSKVNSHMSLVLMQRSAGSHENSSLDLFRPFSSIHGNMSGGSGSPRDENSDTELTNMNDVIQRLARVRSLQRRRAQSTTPKFGKIAENEVMSTSADKKFSLQFGPPRELPPDSESSNQNLPKVKSPASVNHHKSDPEMLSNRRRRSSSIKFIPSVLKEHDENKKLQQLIFYHLASDLSMSGSDEEESGSESDQKYQWFGQNIKR